MSNREPIRGYGDGKKNEMVGKVIAFTRKNVLRSSEKPSDLSQIQTFCEQTQFSGENKSIYIYFPLPSYIFHHVPLGAP